MNCTDVDGYRIYCDALICDHNSYNLREETPSYSLNVTLYGDGNFDSCLFYCCVSGNNSAGEGLSDCVFGREHL